MQGLVVTSQRFETKTTANLRSKVRKRTEQTTFTETHHESPAPRVLLPFAIFHTIQETVLLGARASQPLASKIARKYFIQNCRKNCTLLTVVFYCHKKPNWSLTQYSTLCRANIIIPQTVNL